MSAQIQRVATNIFCPTNHVIPDTGDDAFWPLGLYGEGYEKCVLCGEVKCTNPPEDTNLDLSEVKGRI